MFAAASGLRLAARRCLIFPPPLSARALVEAFPLHVLEQPGLGDLAAELLQDIVQSVAVAHHYFHVPASLPFGAARNTNTSRRRYRAEDVTQRRRAKTSPHASA